MENSSKHIDLRRLAEIMHSRLKISFESEKRALILEASKKGVKYFLNNFSPDIVGLVKSYCREKNKEIPNFSKEEYEELARSLVPYIQEVFSE